MKSGIYLIRFLLNNKVYIGQSINIDSRIKSHKYCLNNNRHKNILLQRYYNKYGENFFKYEVLGYFDKSTLDLMEVYYIQYYNSIKNGFNLESGGNHKKQISEISKLKMSNAKKGKPSMNKGRKASPETIQKLIISHLGKLSPRKGMKVGKTWNKGLKGVQISTKRKPLIATDCLNKKFLGEFKSILDFKEKINVKSKNITKINENTSKIGRYILEFKIAVP